MTSWFRTAKGAFVLAALLMACGSPRALAHVANEGKNCYCDQFEHLVPTSSLAQSMSDIGLELMNKEGLGLMKSQEEQQALRLRIAAKAMIPAECREELLKRQTRRFGLYLRKVIEGPPPGTQSMVGTGMHDLQQTVLSTALVQRCWQLSRERKTPSYCTQGDTATRLREFLKEPDQVIMDQVAMARKNGVDWLLQGRDPKLDSQGLKMFRHFNELLLRSGDTDPKSALNYLSSISKSLSTDEKLRLVTTFGEYALWGYDDDRADQAAKAKGVVTFQTILRASRSNLRTGLLETFQAGTREYAGVCRDIASAQVEMLNALGMPHSYAVAFSTQGALHVTAITHDPKDPNIVYKLAYGDRRTSIGADGGEALFQGDIDNATNYWIYKPGGSPVANVPSEFTKIMAEATGFDVKQLDALATPKGSLIAADAMISKSASTPAQARLFMANSPIGQTYLGASTMVGLAQQSITPGKLGVSLGIEQLPMAIDNNAKDRSTAFLYFQAEQKIMTPWISTSEPRLRARLENTATLLGSVTKEMDNPKAELSFAGDLRIDSGIAFQANPKATKEDPDPDPGDPQSKLYAGVQVFPGVSDIRNSELVQSSFPYVAQPILPYLNFVKLAGESRIPLRSDHEAYAVVAGTALCGQLGCRGKAEVAAAIDEIAASFAVQGALSGDSPKYEEGTQRKISTNLMFNLFHNPGLMLEVSGFKSIEKDGDIGATGTLKISR